MEKSRAPKRRKSSNFIIQGSILAAAGIIVRLIGMLYRIPLANIIGDEGNGYYSSAFSVYSILLIVSSYSLPVAVSKMIAAKMARGEYRNSLRILKAALFYGTLVGAAGAAVLWFGADFFANTVLHMAYTSYALKTLAPTIWIMAYLGVLRGYFQGLGTMLPTALSQILEQIVNAVISVTAASYLFRAGLIANLIHNDNNFSYAFGASGGTIGTGAGAAFALLFLLFILLNYRTVMRRQARRDRTRSREGYGRISYVLLMTVLPVVLSSAVYNVSSVVDNAIYANAMSSMGVGESQIASSWGIMGKYHLLFNIPVAIANSLSSSLIPSLSRAVANKSRTQIVGKVATVIRFSMIIAIPATVGLTVLAAPINNLLFSRYDNAELIKMTMAGSLAVVFFSLSTVTNAVLQGINRMQVPIKNAVISLILHVVILLVMLFGLKLGIYSVVYSNILFAFFMCVLNNRAIRRYLRYRQEMKKTFVLPALASAVMGGAAYLFYMLSHRALSALLPSKTMISLAVSVAFSVMMAVLVYGFLLLRLRCVDERELSAVPGGKKVIRLAVRFHLM